MVVSGEHSDNIDIDGEGRITSLDAPMIMHGAVGYRIHRHSTRLIVAFQHRTSPSCSYATEAGASPIIRPILLTCMTCASTGITIHRSPI